MGLRELLSAYVADRINLSRLSIQQMEIAVDLLSAFLCRPATTGDLSKVVILSWMRWLSDGRAPRTVNSKRGVIVTLWTYAADHGLTTACPRIPKRIEPARIPVAWTLTELDRLFAACDSMDGAWSGVPVRVAWKIAFLVSWDTGCRIGTLLGLETRYLDLARRTLIAPASILKGGRGDRVFFLHPQTMALIAASKPQDRRYVWPFPWKRRQVWPHLKRLLRSAGLPADRSRMFHCLRRSAESYAAKDRGIEWAAAAVGHSVAVARKSYVSPLIACQPALIDALPRPAVR